MSITTAVLVMAIASSGLGLLVLYQNRQLRSLRDRVQNLEGSA